MTHDTVSDFEEDKRNYYNHNDGEEVEKLATENSSVPVCQDSKVVALDIAKRQNEVSPTILVD